MLSGFLVGILIRAAFGSDESLALRRHRRAARLDPMRALREE
jgi:hypothetical protein